MSQLDAVADGDEPPRKKQKYQPKRLKQRAMQITMPKRSAAAYPEKKHTETKQVTVIADGTNQMWVSKADLAWLIVCMCDEFSLGASSSTPRRTPQSRDRRIARPPQG